MISSSGRENESFLPHNNYGVIDNNSERYLEDLGPLFISYTNIEQNYLQIFIPIAIGTIGIGTIAVGTIAIGTIAIGLTPLPTNQFLTFIQNVYLCKE